MTKSQISLEGEKAAAIHAAVRKGDVLLGDGVGALGVKVDSLSVLRGVAKSIFVNTLL